MTAAPEPSTVKRALSAHAAIGLVAGALLYIVCLTGTVAVFYPELQRIEQARAPEMAKIVPAAVQRGVEAALQAEHGGPLTTHLYVHMPVPDLPRATITSDTRATHIDANGALAGPEEIAWSDFLVALHYTLNVPGLVGMTIVGVLGVMILALALSGVIAHPRIFRDAFLLRARNGSGVGLADWHNRMSVWSLPFSVAVALTGAVIGLGSLTVYAMALLDHGGNIQAVYEPLFGEEGKPDKRAAPPPNVATALDYMAQHHPEVTITYVTLHDPLTRGQETQISAEHERRLIFGETYRFDAKGRFIGVAGTSDGELGQQAAASTYRLHFGNFGGLPVKLAYILFGAALTVICATGTYIWLGKRRRRGHEEPRLLKAWDAVVWGSPMVLALTLVARFVLGNGAPLTAIFWIGSLLVVALAFAPIAPQRFRKGLQVLLPAVCLLAGGLALA
ncbi:PepSY-associated TM helix domain-containing protein [Novosphingobium kaempferiae]|uniref:PepSY-associated TM helix domain-containing protein n=1 Tax=Novosphingobium kaempferiae TaxID=2896849 RepID=UPI001E441B7D|nr:PepSY-associated TM helix domain-containing protein [Novosphingobium kaempferiae]